MTLVELWLEVCALGIGVKSGGVDVYVVSDLHILLGCFDDTIMVAVWCDGG